MHNRFWLYLAFGIVLAGLISYWTIEKNSLQASVVSEQLINQQQRVSAMKDFLSRQTNGHKLVSLAKRMNPEDSKLIEMVIMRAYELEPDRRDIAILASTYDSSIEKKIQFLDPLYKK